MKKILLHLHPDFSDELVSVIAKWNAVQNVRAFSGVRSSREHEVRLLTKGKIATRETFKIAARIRNEAGYSPDHMIIVFTEKRIFAKGYDQLYLDGTSSTDTHPNVFTISLDYTRLLFKTSPQNKKFVFQVILSNILSAVALDEDLQTHEDTRGCILDFCNNMRDIIKGIKNGFAFCAEHSSQIRKQKKDYLFELAKIVSRTTPAKKNAANASKRIMSLNKPRLKDNESKFHYDIAISYAGEDRKYAVQVARLLKTSKVNVFYDGFEKATLWGQDLLIYLTDLYKLRAKYCLMFLSKNYARKIWTNHERKAAQSRAFRENRVYILPVRIDNTKIPGVRGSIVYLTWNQEGPKGISQCAVEKLKSYKFR